MGLCRWRSSIASPAFRFKVTAVGYGCANATWSLPRAVGAPRAKAIVELETKIAKVQWTREDSGDAAKTYNKFTLAETAKLSSATLDMPTLLKAISPKITEVLVNQPSAVTGIAKIFDDAPLGVVKDQMLVRSLG